MSEEFDDRPRLFPAIGGGCRRAENLGDNAGCRLLNRVFVCFVAVKHHIRVIKRVDRGNAQLHVRHEGAAWRASGSGAQVERNIHGDALVPLAGAGHHKYLAVVFVLDLRFRFGSQIVFGAERGLFQCKRHGDSSLVHYL